MKKLILILFFVVAIVGIGDSVKAQVSPSSLPLFGAGRNLEGEIILFLDFDHVEAVKGQYAKYYGVHNWDVGSEVDGDLRKYGNRAFYLFNTKMKNLPKRYDGKEGIEFCVIVNKTNTGTVYLPQEAITQRIISTDAAGVTRNQQGSSYNYLVVPDESIVFDYK